ncbi:hypothetical protein AAIH70_29940 [Neorhizobium sp. BT27B]|uniref:hypothetical protein n=1 Tax=Neorhizobium sp. BT27B TaxID=3142625 RepID=UPI003D29D49A
MSENGSTIEVSLDRGVALSVDREAPFLELELELKEGNARDLFVLARKIEAIVPFRFGVLSKAERGFRLLGAAQVVVKLNRLLWTGARPRSRPSTRSCSRALGSFA